MSVIGILKSESISRSDLNGYMCRPLKERLVHRYPLSVIKNGRAAATQVYKCGSEAHYTNIRKTSVPASYTGCADRQ